MFLYPSIQERLGSAMQVLKFGSHGKKNSALAVGGDLATMHEVASRSRRQNSENTVRICSHRLCDHLSALGALLALDAV